jgi:5-methylcytosine-specific restriction enzyme subunit McrC
VKRRSITRGRLVCQFDELSPDVVHNRILKAALTALAKSSALERSLCDDVIELRSNLAGVTEIPLARHLFNQLQLSRSTRPADADLRAASRAATPYRGRT